MCERSLRSATFSGGAIATIRPPASPAFRPEVDDPVGLGDHVEIVLDDDDRVAGVDQAVQHAHQLLDVGHVQADGRLVEDVERVLVGSGAAGPAGSVGGVGPDLRELGDELDALRLAAGERRALLPERQVAEPDVLQQRQAAMDRRMRGEEVARRRRRSSRARRRWFAPASGRQRLGVEARAAARFAGHLHVGQEAHLDPLHPLALARFAAAARGVEREAAARCSRACAPRSSRRRAGGPSPRSRRRSPGTSAASCRSASGRPRARGRRARRRRSTRSRAGHRSTSCAARRRARRGWRGARRARAWTCPSRRRR